MDEKEKRRERDAAVLAGIFMGVVIFSFIELFIYFIWSVFFRN